jgi:hypothetical protein
VSQPISPIDTLAPVGPQPAATAAGNASPEFRRILERLEQLAQHSTPAAPDVDQLQDALRAADDGFASAMELRRKLEAAFQARRP